jgi:hypothetical protein
METPTMESRSLNWAARIAACALLGSSVLAQEPKVKVGKSPDAEPPQQAKKGLDDWVRELGSESFRVRIDAEKALRGLGEAALPALRKAAAESTDDEVQWRARRLVRQIEHGAEAGLQERDREAQEPPVAPRRLQGQRRLPPGLPDDMREHFEELFRHMEQDFGLDIPRARFFQDDFFRDLQEQMDAGIGRSQGLSMQIGPDGAVRVEVKQKNDKGEVESKVYEAPDLETFHKQYPGVLQQNGLGGGMQFWMGQPLRQRALQMQPLNPRGQLQPGLVVPPPDVVTPPAADGPRLGVMVRPEIPADVREYLDLPEGEGLMVEGVQPDSLAQALGLQRGDIVHKIGGTAVGSTADVQQALAAIEPGKPVEVHYIRRGAAKTATANRPLPPAKAESKGR